MRFHEKLRDLAGVGSRSVIRRTGHVEPGADDTHVNHRPDPDLFIAPAIRIHRAKIGQLEFG